MYTLRNIARRGTMFAGAGALFFASIASGSSAFADALNPLTHRSLTLSSSAPGWNYTDGSGNTTYAVPNSGANGQKTGNTFSFNVSTDSATAAQPLKAFTFQYCTKSAGNCYAPGNDPYTTTRGADSATNRTSDLNVVTQSTLEFPNASYGSYFTSGTVTNMVPADNSKGNFIVLWKHAGTWQQNTGWSMSASNVESGPGTIATGERTGKNNFITLTNASSTLLPSAGDPIKIIFFGTNTNYITNPGQGAFFVKINDYKSDTTLTDPNLVDGGVTVANVMNQSIQITTKVLETMDFSVGTVDPFTLPSDDGNVSTASTLEKALGVAADNNAIKHTPCQRILTGIDAADVASQNVLQMGDATAENSLSTDHTYSTHSYWRLSSNSSAGATVYYSGVTLSNTVGDQIDAINSTNNGVAAKPQLGAEQFGLALANGTIAANNPMATFNPDTNVANVFPVNYTVERAALKLYENGADNAYQSIHASTTADVGSNASYHTPRLWPLKPATNYDRGAGNVNADYNTVDTYFAFDTQSNLIPTPIADESNQVVDCVTGKMRYIANIAATTPAGIYTTKINYIAAPQY